MARCFIHGFACLPSMWDGVAEAADQRMLLPGHGGRAPLPTDDFCAVVDALVAELEAESHLIGYSLGARVALALGMRHPERVASLTLIGVHAGLEEAERASRRHWDAAMAAAIEHDMATWVERWEALPIFADQRSLPSRERAQIRAMRQAHEPAALAWAMRTLGLGNMPDWRPALVASRLPTVLVTGSEDAKFAAEARALRTLAPHLEHRVVAGAGHNPVVTASAQLRAML